MKSGTQEELQQYFISLCDLQSQAQVAKDLNFTRAYINDLYHKRRPINEEVANRLGYTMKVIFEKVRNSVDTAEKIG